MRRLASRWPLAVAAGALLLGFAAGAQPKLRGKLNLNTATEAQLCMLPGIGPSTAKKIVEARQERPFTRPMEIVRVRGIGMKRFRTLEPYLAVEGPNDLVRLDAPSKKGKKKGRPARSGTRYRALRSAPGPKIIDVRGRQPAPSSASKASASSAADHASL